MLCSDHLTHFSLTTLPCWARPLGAGTIPPSSASPQNHKSNTASASSLLFRWPQMGNTETQMVIFKERFLQILLSELHVWRLMCALSGENQRNAFKRACNKKKEQRGIHRGCMSQPILFHLSCFFSLWTIWRSRNCNKCVKKNISYPCICFL